MVVFLGARAHALRRLFRGRLRVNAVCRDNARWDRDVAAAGLTTAAAVALLIPSAKRYARPGRLPAGRRTVQ